MNMQLNKDKDLNALRTELEKISKDFAKKHGVAFAIGKMRYDRDGSRMTVTLDFMPIKKGEKVQTDSRIIKASSAFMAYYTEFGFKKSDLGKTIKTGTNGTKKLTIMGLLPRRKKSVLLMDKKTGQTYTGSAELVLKHLKR